MLSTTRSSMALPRANELTDCGHRLRARVQVSRHEDGLLSLLAPERPDGSSASRWLVLFESCMNSDDFWSVLEVLATARAMAAGFCGQWRSLWSERPRKEGRARALNTAVIKNLIVPVLVNCLDKLPGPTCLFLV